MKTAVPLSLVILAIMAAPKRSAADPITLNRTIAFTKDSPGAKPNGFSSVESDLVRFTDSDGSDLEIQDFGNQSRGNGLAVNFDDDSFLIMDFRRPIKFLSLAFGNDEPSLVRPGELAVLKAFWRSAEVASSVVEMNRNDVMDQTISIGGGVFDRITFTYAVSPEPEPEGLIEVVDDITLAPVPEPATLTLLGVGAVSLVARCRHRGRRGS